MTTITTAPMDPGGIPALTDQLVSATLEGMAKRRDGEPVPPARAAARKLVA